MTDTGDQGGVEEPKRAFEAPEPNVEQPPDAPEAYHLAGIAPVDPRSLARIHDTLRAYNAARTEQEREETHAALLAAIEATTPPAVRWDPRPGRPPKSAPTAARTTPATTEYEPGEEEDLGGDVESFGLRTGERVPIPPEERTRRTLLWALGAGWVLMLVAQVALALVLSSHQYQVVGAAMAGAQSVIAGLFGGIVGFYTAGSQSSR